MPRAAERASSRDRNLAIAVVEQRLQNIDYISARADAGASRRAHRGVRVSQQQDPELRRKIAAQPGGRGHRGGEVRPLDDSLGNQTFDLVARVAAADRGEGVERRGLLRDQLFEAEADESSAEPRERRYRVGQSSPAGFGGERAGLVDSTIHQRGYEFAVGEVRRRSARGPRLDRTLPDRRTAREQIELDGFRHAQDFGAGPETLQLAA
jgi:hypothetical protein